MKKTLFASFILGAASAGLHAQETPPPNIVLILCDDMGFSDIGCYGGEVETPCLDSLAREGVRFSQFKNTGRSCPTRASLLTGRYQHEVGMGWMTAVDEHRPGYRGQLSKEYPTIAEVLKDNGYATYMSGKWHVTVDGAFQAPNGSYPVQRGFDRYYGCLSGGGSYYKPKPVYNDLTPVTEFPDDYYYTTALTDSAVSFIRQCPDTKPMFLYVAYYAPHLPLQAPAERVEKCLERYKAGYDILRRQRFERQKEMGLVPADMELPIYNKEFGGKRPAWEELTEEQRRQWTQDMATYAAMIEIMDEGVGQIVDAFRQKGTLDNTVFLFLSDNGATLEGGYLGQLMADLSNTPYRSYKQWCFQGGTSTPFILTYGDPHKNRMKGKILPAMSHVIDLLPTCMDLASATWPARFNHADLPGRSLLPVLDGKPADERTLFFEHQSSCASIKGSWKLARANQHEPWELFDLQTDPFETKNLAGQQPEKVKALENEWNAWAKETHVFPLEDKPWGQRIDFYKKQNSDQDGVDNPVPASRQLKWHEAEMGVVFHYDLHVFDGQVYGQGNNRINPVEDYNIFNPTQLDTDQWIEAAKAAGAKFAVLTATHETGFGLWQSDVNPYCLKSVKWRDGKGDIVRDFVNSCRKYGIRPGIYVGIRWNSLLGIHNFKAEGDGEFARNRQAWYKRLCEKMVTELCTRYGDLFLIWFDGGADDPTGLGPDVEPIVNKYQPNCLFYHNVNRADFRWGGSESGTVGYPCWSTFPTPYSHSNATDGVQAHNVLLAHGTPDGAYWVPAMADTPLRGYNGRHEWFWEPGDDDKALYPLDHLMDIYEKSVGRNATLIVGLTPNPDGVLPAGDVQRLKEWGREIDRRFGHPLAQTSGHSSELQLSLEKAQDVCYYILQEDIRQGERIRSYRIEAKVGGKWETVAQGTSVGHKRIGTFDTLKASDFRVVVEQSTDTPCIRNFSIYGAGED